MEKDILEEIYRLHAKQIYLYLYSLCHCHSLAEDLMQETFLRAFCSMEIAGESIVPWLFIVARNLYIDYWRKEKRMIKKRQGWESERMTEETDGGKGLLEQFIKKEQNVKLYQAIQVLGEIEREAIVLYYFSGLSQEEIGQILGLTYGNTRVLLYRAKRKLKEILDHAEGK